VQREIETAQRENREYARSGEGEGGGEGDEETAMVTAMEGVTFHENNVSADINSTKNTNEDTNTSEHANGNAAIEESTAGTSWYQRQRRGAVAGPSA
jgi:hypothetical protein